MTSPEIAALAEQMGIDPSQLSGGFGGASSPTVYLGEQTGPMAGVKTGSTGPVKDGDRAFQPDTFVSGGPLSDTGRAFKPVSEARGLHEDTVDSQLASLYTMNEARLRDLQRRLLDGGFYRTSPENIGWGTPDEATVDAFSTALTRAAAYYAAGVKKTPHEVIKDAAKARMEAEDEFRQGVVGGGNVYTINLSDPASLRRVADRISSEVLGRKADPEMEQKIANAIRSAQASEQGKVNSARESATRQEFAARQGAVGGQDGYIAPTTVTANQVDPEARAEEMLRNEFPLEAAGMDAADGYRAFLGLLSPGGIN